MKAARLLHHTAQCHHNKLQAGQLTCQSSLTPAAAHRYPHSSLFVSAGTGQTSAEAGIQALIWSLRETNTTKCIGFLLKICGYRASQSPADTSACSVLVHGPPALLKRRQTPACPERHWVAYAVAAAQRPCPSDGAQCRETCRAPTGSLLSGSIHSRARA